MSIFIIHGSLTMKNIKSLIGITLWGFISILMFIIILLQLMKEHNVVYIFLLIIFLINSLLCLYISIYKLLNMKKKYLKREYLINKFEESKAVFKPGVRNAHILSFLRSIKKLMNDCTYKKDSRYVTFGRLDFLEKETNEKLHNNDLAGALLNLEEYVRLPGHFDFSQIPKNFNFKDLYKNYHEYYKNGIICNEEKDKILNIINIIEDYINSSYIKKGNE